MQMPYLRYSFILTFALLCHHGLVLSAQEEAESIQILIQTDNEDQFLHVLSQHNWSQADIQKAFFKAIKLGYLKAVDTLIKHKSAQVNEAKEDGSPLYAAAYYGRVKILRLLIDEGADIYYVTQNTAKDTLYQSHASRAI